MGKNLVLCDFLVCLYCIPETGRRGSHARPEKYGWMKRFALLMDVTKGSVSHSHDGRRGILSSVSMHVPFDLDPTCLFRQRFSRCCLIVDRTCNKSKVFDPTTSTPRHAQNFRQPYGVFDFEHLTGVTRKGKLLSGVTCRT